MGEDELPGFGVGAAAHRTEGSVERAAGSDTGHRGRAVPDHYRRPQLRAPREHDRHSQGHPGAPREAVRAHSDISSPFFHSVFDLVVKKIGSLSA